MTTISSLVSLFIDMYPEETDVEVAVVGLV